MSPKSFLLTDDLHTYLLAHTTPIDAVQKDLIVATASLGDPARMQVAPEQGEFLTLITRIVGARRAVEIGTFTGYSTLCIAKGLSDRGKLVTCDISNEWTSIARHHWQMADLEDRIELRLGPAIDSLRALQMEPVIDLAFIDADKPNYISYYEELVPRVRPNGVLLADNVLWGGSVLRDPALDDVNLAAIRDFNDHLMADDRVETVMLPLADGVTIARKR